MNIKDILRKLDNALDIEHIAHYGVPTYAITLKKNDLDRFKTQIEDIIILGESRSRFHDQVIVVFTIVNEDSDDILSAY